MLMSNKLREKLEICNPAKTTVSCPDAESVPEGQKTINIFACKTQCRRSSLVLCTAWSSSAIPVCFSASVTEMLLCSTFPSTFSLLFILTF